MRVEDEQPSFVKTLDWDLYLAVSIGGVVGASFRHLWSIVVPVGREGWPWPTFITNLSGAFILGIVLVVAARIAADPQHSAFARRLRPFLITGVLGGYTTFSTYMVETHGLVVEGKPVLAGAYIFGSALLGIFMVAFGMALTAMVFEHLLPRLTAQQEAVIEEDIRKSEDEA